MKKLGTIILVGLLALAILVSPVVMASTSNNYLNTVSTDTTCPGYGTGAGTGPAWQANSEAFSDIINILADLSGYDAASLTAITQDYNFNIARLINTVVLSKVMNISLDEAANIVSQGDLRTYIEDNNITDQFTSTRQSYALEIREARGGMGLGNGHGHGHGHGYDHGCGHGCGY